MRAISLVIVVFSFYFIIPSRALFCQEDKFSTAWNIMRKSYQAIKLEPKYAHMSKYSNFFYENLISDLDKLVLSSPREDFLLNSCLTNVMVRCYDPNFTAYEEAFLNYCISDQTKKMIASFSEENYGFLDRDCGKLSTTSLGHLFYVAKNLEFCDRNSFPEVIMEIGGGFGNLAKCFKQVLRNCTIVIIDLPEMSVIQNMFLSYVLPDVKVILHVNDVCSIEKGAINLVPVYLIEELVLEPDLFVSTFALSEASQKMQELVIAKNFFNAKKVYITGQLNGWEGIGIDWIVDHQLIINALRSGYKKTTCIPFHLLKKDFLSYEVLASK
jgi:hypothetical protein